jgi:hypothetical protein
MNTPTSEIYIFLRHSDRNCVGAQMSRDATVVGRKCRDAIVLDATVAGSKSRDASVVGRNCRRASLSTSNISYSAVYL